MSRPLHDLTAVEIANRLHAGSLTATALIEALLAHTDGLEPRLAAWVTRDRQGALEAARQIDALARTPEGASKPLLGVPIGAKDIFNVEGLPTTAGSPIYRDFIAPADAPSIARLKQAGAVILGKTVTTQFAATDPPSTRNPWDSRATPGGSSSGSAVAVAARMVPAALGSQTAGSTIRPAAYNGVVGFKPTYGRISRIGVFPLARTLDTVGIITRTVEDATLLLQAMAGHDPADPLSSERPVPDYRTEMKRHALRPPRIGAVRGFFDGRAMAEVEEHTAAVIRRLRAAGAIIHDLGLSENLDHILEAHLAVMASEAAAIHRETFGPCASEYAPGIRAIIEQGLGASAVDYLLAQRERQRFREKVGALFGECDVLLCPPASSPAPYDLSTTGDRAFQTPWTFAGVPTMTLPSGLSPTGLPLGVQLIGPHFEEGLLLGAAHWCEKALGVEQAPPL